MSGNSEKSGHEDFVRGVIESAIKVSLLAIMLIWCFQIIKPFISLILWGGIIAVALYPACLFLKNKTGKSTKFSATLVSLILLTFIIAPMTLLSSSMIDTGTELSENVMQGDFSIPPPNDSVAEWPIIGQKVHGTWSMFSENLNEAAEHFKPQLKELGKQIISMSANTGLTILLFIGAIILAGIMMNSAEAIKTEFTKITKRLIGERAEDILSLSIATIRSVAQGVIGIALIQATLAAPALIIMEVPLAGVWVLAILILTIVQLPALIVIGPIIFYVFSVADSTSAIVFTVYIVLVGFSDALLKPMLLGRGVDVPMLVILLGAIGGMIFSGLIGLFTGAVVLALSYTLIRTWIDHDLDEKIDSIEHSDTK